MRHAVTNIMEASWKAAAVPVVLLIGLFVRADMGGCWMKALGAAPLVWRVI